MAKFAIYDKNTHIQKVDEKGRVIYADSLEYTGTWMGECFLSVTVKSPYPIEWNIGDYIIYRDETFIINNDASIKKQAEKGWSADGFLYEGIKFSAYHTELTDIRFLDYVLQDNKIHWTSLPIFPFFAATIDDFCDRLQANTNRWCTDNGIAADDAWLFLTPNKDRTRYRAEETIGMSKQEFLLRWEQAYGRGTAADEAKGDVSVSINNQNIWDTLAMIKNDFNLNFINRGRSVIVGSAGVPTSKIFSYGKGNGLYEIERVADTSQQVTTKLYGYGTETNLPIRYYASIGVECCALLGTVPVGDGAYWYIDIPFGKCFTTPYDADAGSFIATMTNVSGSVGVTAVLADPAKLSEKYAALFPADSTLLELNNYSPFTPGQKVVFTGGVDKDKWPASKRIQPDGDKLPNNMAVNRLMLPGFPEKSLKAWVLENGGYTNTDGSVTWNGHTAFFSDEQYNPYVMSKNYKSIGIREGIKIFDGSDDTEEIFPTLKGASIAESETIADNGIFNEGDDEPTFYLYLPDLGFDLAEYANQGISRGGSPSIYMKSGYCGSREFAIITKSNGNADIERDGLRWKCHCKREHDTLLDLWFPYSYSVSQGGSPSSDEVYQVRAEDEFILKGIPMPDVYINAAAEDLLAATLTFLEKNDYTRYTYTPKVDEIFMARQNDIAEKDSSGDTISIYKTIKEGDLLVFNEEDFGVRDANIFIDTLTIKENGNADIPTYDITLREDKAVGSIQKIQNQISSLASGFYGGGSQSGSGSGGGYTTNQIKNIVRAYGDENYLSKKNDDKAAGLITFLKGLISNGNATFLKGLISKGDVTFEQILKSSGAISGFIGGNGIYMDAVKGLIETDGLEVRGFMRIMELVINRLQLMESDYSFTEGDETEHVDVINDGSQMLFTMHKEFDADTTPFYPGDVLYAKVNDLLSHGTYYTCWVRVVSVDQTDNTLTVVPYEGAEVPGGTNFTPIGTAINGETSAMDALAADLEAYPDGYDIQMNVTRHGNNGDGINPETGQYDESIHQSQLGRQQSWVLSTTDGRISYFWHVTKPIIEEDNYALALGILPDLSVLPSNRDKTMPSLYVNTVFAGSFQRINYPAKVVRVDRGSWASTPSSEYTGSASGTFTVDGTLDELLSDSDYTAYWPHINAIKSMSGAEYNTGDVIREPYHNKTFTINDWLSYRLSDAWKSKTDKELYLLMKDEWHTDIDLEVSRVWHGGLLWECITDCTSEEPEWGSSAWRYVSGSTVFALNFFTADEDPLPLTVVQVYPNQVDFIVVPYLVLGDEDVSNLVTSWQWKRSSFDTSGDEQWNAGVLTRQRSLNVTNADVPTGWGRGKKLEFICTATFTSDGSQSEIVNRIKF